MYGFSSDTNVDFFVGAQLSQVCVGENEVILHCHPSISVMIASTVRLTEPNTTQRLLEDSRETGSALLPLLGSVVSDVSATPDGTLRLHWSSEHVLEILDSWEEFESYTIQHGDATIVV